MNKFVAIELTKKLVEETRDKTRGKRIEELEEKVVKLEENQIEVTLLLKKIIEAILKEE